MRWQLTPGTRPAKVALFCSQYLHCIADLLGALAFGRVGVPHRHPSSPTIATLRAWPVSMGPFRRPSNHRRPAWPLKLISSICFQRLRRGAGCARALHAGSLAPALSITISFSLIINVHHSFLPAFTGAPPYHAAHARGVKLIGATSHYVTEVLDDGPIIEQDVARISHRDQVADLVARRRDLERVVLSRAAIRSHLDSPASSLGNKTVVFD